jgi:hypothetical protein
MTKVLLLAGLLVVADGPREQCWFSDGWHKSGYYDCKLGPWMRDEETLETPSRDRGWRNDRNSGQDPN